MKMCIRDRVHTADDLYLVDQSPADQEKEDSNEESSIVGRSYTLKITLDDLKNEASRFVSIYGKKNQQLVNRGITQLNAGTNLHIKVTVRSDNYKIDGLATECTTNSLLADQSTSNQAVVYYGRHLQNLDLASGVTAVSYTHLGDFLNAVAEVSQGGALGHD